MQLYLGSLPWVSPRHPLVLRIYGGGQKQITAQLTAAERRLAVSAAPSIPRSTARKPDRVG